MTDRPTIAEQIDAVEWAENHVGRLRHFAALDPKRKFTPLRVAHAKGLTVEQYATLKARLEAAVDTLRMLEFARETL